jgi:hypothetical protein
VIQSAHAPRPDSSAFSGTEHPFLFGLRNEARAPLLRAREENHHSLKMIFPLKQQWQGIYLHSKKQNHAVNVPHTKNTRQCYSLQVILFIWPSSLSC